MTDAELLKALGYLRITKIAVATGGPKIDLVNFEFRQKYAVVASELAFRGIENPIPYGDL